MALGGTAALRGGRSPTMSIGSNAAASVAWQMQSNQMTPSARSTLGAVASAPVGAAVSGANTSGSFAANPLQPSLQVAQMPSSMARGRSPPQNIPQRVPQRGLPQTANGSILVGQGGLSQNSIAASGNSAPQAQLDVLSRTNMSHQPVRLQAAEPAVLQTVEAAVLKPGGTDATAQIAGQVVTKTTVEKVFIPSELGAQAVPVGANLAQIAAAPGITTTATQAPAPMITAAPTMVQALPAPDSYAPMIAAAPVRQLVDSFVPAAPVRQVAEHFASITVPAISGTAALGQSSGQYDYASVVAGKSMSASPVDGSIPVAHYVPVPESNSYSPELMYVDDDHMNMYQGSQEMDGQGVMYQYDETGALIQIPFDNRGDLYPQQQYDDQGYYVEDHQYHQEMVDQQYDDGGYAAYMDQAQGNEAEQNYEAYDMGADVAAGIPRPQEEKRDETPSEDQFTRLLNSLEARVDLMAQMQHTRAEIQKHTRTLQTSSKFQPRSLSQDDGHARLALPGIEPRTAPVIELEPERPFSNLVTDFKPQRNSIVSNAPNGDEALGEAGVQLARENEILRNEFQDQRSVINKLQTEVASMRSTMRSLSVEPQPRDGGYIDSSRTVHIDTRTRARTPEVRIRGTDIIQDGRHREFTFGTRVEARWMKDDGSAAPMGSQWLPGRISRANADGSYAVDYDNGTACRRVPRNCLRRCGEADVPFDDGLRGTSQGEEVKDLKLALLQERRQNESSTQQWLNERRRLLDELSALKHDRMGPGGMRALGNLPTVGESGELETDFSSFALATAPVMPVPGLMAPLSRVPCGMNIELSEDGYTAKRIRGCRQSVVVGSAPLQPQELGHYFEVVVQETVNGWVGGLGIGVTRVSPAELNRMPDKAWRIPNTFIVGYWGCLFLDGREKRTRWKADTLAVGSRVGLLVTGDGRGDLIVFVDGEPVVRADDVLPASTSGIRDLPLYPVIDVFAATLAVELQQSAVAPAKPWSKDPSPPGSPASVARSVGSTLNTTLQTGALTTSLRSSAT